MKNNLGPDIIYKPDGTQVVKRVPDGYYLVHVPSGFYFPPGSQPGWKGILLDQDWDLVPVREVSIAKKNYKPSFQQKGQSAKYMLRQNKEVQFVVHDEIEKIEKMLQQNFYKHLVKSDLQSKKIRKVYEELLQHLEKFVELFNLFDNKIQSSIGQIKHLKTKQKLENSFQNVKTAVLQIQSLLSSKSALKSVVSFKDLMSIYKPMLDVVEFVNELAKRKNFVGFEKLHIEGLKSIFALRMLGLLSDLVSLAERVGNVGNQPLSPQELEVYGNFVNLVLTQLDRAVAILSNPVFISSVYGDYNFEEAVKNNFLDVPEALLEFIYDSYNSPELDAFKKKEIDRIFVNDTTVLVKFKDNAELQISLEDPRTGIYYPFVMPSVYRGRNILSPAVLRIYDTEKASGFVNFGVSVILKDKTSEEHELSLQLKFVPISYYFSESGIHTLYSLDRGEKELKSAIDRARARFNKLKELYSLVDVEDLMRNLSQKLFSKSSTQEEIYLAVEILDYLLLIERNRDIFLGGSNVHAVKAKDLVRKLFGVYNLFGKEDREKLDSNCVEIGDNIYYPYTYVLAASLLNLSQLDYVYARNEQGILLNFKLKSSREFINDVNTNHEVLEMLSTPEENLLAKTLDFLIEQINYLISNKFVPESEISKYTAQNLDAFLREDPRFPLLDQKIKNEILRLFIDDVLKNHEELIQKSDHHYIGAMFERLFVSTLRSLIMINAHDTYSTVNITKNKVNDIPVIKIDLDKKTSIFFLMDEKGGVGDVRILIVNNGEKVLPILYELKTRSKVIVPQIHSVADLYETMKSVLTNYYGEKEFEVYTPKLYAFGLKKPEKFEIEGATPYIIDMNEDYIVSSVPNLQPIVEERETMRKIRQQSHFVDKNFKYVVIKKSHALVSPYSYMVTSISLPESDID